MAVRCPLVSSRESSRRRQNSTDSTYSRRRTPSAFGRSGALSIAPRRSHSIDGQHLCGAAVDEAKAHEALTDRIEALLQEQLEQRVIAVRPIATPPPWKRPWAATPRGDIADKQLQGPQFRPSLAQARPSTGLREANGCHGLRAQGNSPKRKKELMSKVLRELLPANTSSHDDTDPFLDVEKNAPREESSRQRSISIESSDSKSARNANDVAAEVATFRATLSKSFGNLTRAFRAMKNAVSLHGDAASAASLGNSSSSALPTGRSASVSQRLTCAEFEWCVSAYLRYGDRKLARRLFVALDHECRGHISLLQLAQQNARRGLLSLVEFRRLLLDRHASLANAFRELEEYLETQPTESQRGAKAKRSSRSVRKVQLSEFVEATAFFGLDVQQASHFFAIMDIDGDGHLTLCEFLDALTHMPRNVLLQDLRKRMLVQYPSMSKAFCDLTHGGSRSSQLDLKSFSAALARLGIVDLEASEIFRIIDEDESGSVSIDEFRDAMREVAPTISIEVFWQRFAAEWPEVSAAARAGGAAAREHAGRLMLELLPPDLRDRCGVVPLPRWMCRERISEAASLPVQLILGSCTAEVFDGLAGQLDVSKANAQDLFKHIAAAASLRRPTACFSSSGLLEAQTNVGVSDKSFKEVYLEDFLEQLQLWIDNPLGVRPVRDQDGATSGSATTDVIGGVLGDLLAPSKAAVSALKAQLTPAVPEPHRPQEKASSRGSGRARKVPRPPWQLISTALPVPNGQRPLEDFMSFHRSASHMSATLH